MFRFKVVDDGNYTAIVNSESVYQTLTKEGKDAEMIKNIDALVMANTGKSYQTFLAEAKAKQQAVFRCAKGSRRGTKSSRRGEKGTRTSTATGSGSTASTTTSASSTTSSGTTTGSSATTSSSPTTAATNDDRNY